MLKTTSANLEDDDKVGDSRLEEELYTFVCRQRFDRIDRDIKKTLELIKDLRFGSKAG